MPALPILIIGAGPVGLSLARALNHHHLPVQVFETLPALSAEARASIFYPSTLEIWADWGVIDPVLKLGHRVDRLEYWERARRAWAIDRVQRYTHATYAALTAKDEATRQTRNDHFRALAADPAQARAYRLRASMLDERITSPRFPDTTSADLRRAVG